MPRSTSHPTAEDRMGRSSERNMVPVVIRPGPPVQFFAPRVPTDGPIRLHGSCEQSEEGSSGSHTITGGAYGTAWILVGGAGGGGGGAGSGWPGLAGGLD